MGNFNRDRSSGRRDFGGRRDFRRTQMYDAVCDECGKKCQVPFRPSGDKPIYCSECFEQKSGGSPRRRDNRRDSGRRRETRMYNAVCDGCGRKCEVPFQPTSGKPIFCDDCFKSTSGSNKGKDRAPKDQNMQKQIDAINSKLERILKILEPTSFGKKESKKKNVTKKAASKKKKIVAKKVASKKQIKAKTVAKKARKATKRKPVKKTVKKSTTKKVAKKKPVKKTRAKKTTTKKK